MELSIAENFLLLAHHPLKGRFIISEVMINYGLPGAFLMELSVKGKIDISNNRLILRKHRESNRVLAEIINIISQANRPKKVKTWIQLLARKSGRYKKTLLEQMASKKLIYIQHNTFLGFIRFRKYYVKDNKSREQLIAELKNAILKSGELNADIVPLLGLVEACKMYKILSDDKKEQRLIKHKLKVMVKEMPMAGILDETIRQVQTAIIASITASTVATTASH